MEERKSQALEFEFVDIEIISPLQNKATQEKWDCDHCSIYFLTREKLNEHKQKHSVQSTDKIVKCKYCNKVVFNLAKNKVSYANRKCETCEYRCSSCPKRFLRHSSLINHEQKHSTLKKTKENSKGTSKSVVCHIKNGKVQKKTLSVPDINKQSGKNQKKAAIKRKRLDLIYEDVQTNVVHLQKNRLKKRKVLTLDEKGHGDNIIKNKTKMGKNLVLQRNSKVPIAIRQIKIEQECINTSNLKTVNEKVISYKPFSCHVCSDTFATDGNLINHIKVHGENALNAFKCKWCGDEFDDIYKMQFHLAICSLAEDELESTLTHTIPIQFTTDTASGKVYSDARLSRKKITQTNKVNIKSVMESTIHKVTKSQSTRKSIRNKSSVKNLVTNTVVDSLSLKPDFDKKSSIVLLNEINGFQNSYEEFQNNDPEEHTFEHNEINLSSTKVLPLQTFGVNDYHRTKEHICPFPRCSMNFSRAKALLCHMRNHSDDYEDILKCHKCDIPFDDIHSLRLHINICKGIKEEKDDDFDRQDTLNSKAKIRFSPQSKNKLQCKVCARTYKSVENLSRHVLRHRNKNYKCRICELVFNNQPILDKHCLDKHLIKSPYHCVKCNEDFISELFLQIHKSDYHGEDVNKSPIFQDASGSRKPFSKRPSTRLKMLRKHSYSSTIVNYRYTGRPNNNYWCPVCYEKFNNRGNMWSHLQQHHIEKNKSKYICEVCEVIKPDAEMLCCHLELHSLNSLSVNRFSKLKGYITNTQVSSINDNKSWVKKENVNDNEDQIKIKQEVPADNNAPHSNRQRTSNRIINKVLTRSQLGEEILSLFKPINDSQRGKNVQTSLNANVAEDAVDLIECAVEKNVHFDAVPTVQPIIAETKNAKCPQRKPKSKSNGRMKSRAKGELNNAFENQYEDCTSNLLVGIGLDFKRVKNEIGLSQELLPIDEEGINVTAHYHNKGVHKSLTTSKQCSTQREENLLSDTLSTAWPITAGSKNTKFTQQKCKSKGNGRQKSRAKGKKKIQLKNKHGKSTSNVMAEIGLGIKNMKKENALSYELPQTYYDDINLLINNKKSNCTAHYHHEDELQSVAKDKLFLTPREENLQSHLLSTIQPSIADTMNAKCTQRKFKPRGKGMKQSRAKFKRKIELKNKHSDSISKVERFDEIELDLKNIKVEELSYEIPPINDNINLLENEGINYSISCHSKSELQSLTTNKTSSLIEVHLMCNSQSNQIESDTYINQLEPSNEESDNSLMVLNANMTDQTTTDHLLLPTLVSHVKKELRQSRSDSEDEDEIQCTMCSLKFHHQDDLLDHVGTHF